MRHTYKLLTHLILLATLMQVAQATITIQSVNHPIRQIQGGTIPIYVIATDTSNAPLSIGLIVTLPDGTTKRQLFTKTPNTDEYVTNFFDTQQSGTYNLTIAAKKGVEIQTIKSNFTIVDFNIGSVDFVNVVKRVQDVTRVQKITNQTLLKVFGTEYQVGDNGRTFLQLLEGSQPVTNATCDITIYYPNSSLWYNRVGMPYLQGSAGLYYFDFYAKNTTGVYMLNVFCQYVTFEQTYPAAYYELETYGGELIEGNNFSITQSDDNKLKIKESSGSEESINVNITIPNVLAPTNFTRMGISVEYAWGDSKEDIEMWVYNWTSGQYTLLPNTLPKTTIDNVFTNFIFGNINDYVKNNTVKIRFEDESSGTAGMRKTLEIDKVWISFVESTAAVNEIRGGGEIHITQRQFSLLQTILSLLQSVWDFITNDLWNINLNINSTVTQIKNDTTTIIQKIDNLNVTANTNLTPVTNLIQQDLIQKIQIISSDTYMQEQDIVLRAKATKTDNEPATNITITATIYYPNQTIFEQTNMQHLTNGIYYKQITLPATTGEYLATINTTINQKKYSDSKSFNVLEREPQLSIN